MRAKDWIEQAERCLNNGKRQFARRELIDALERMTDEQINALCGDIMHQRAGSDPAGGNMQTAQFSNGADAAENRII